MDNPPTSKLRRQSQVSARAKGQHVDSFKRGNAHLNEDGRRHEFSLDSLDKEILQTMSRGSKNTPGCLPSDSASESSGSTQEKAIYSRQSPHPEPIPFVMQNGVHSGESASKISKKPSEQHHGTINLGQLHAPPSPMWPDSADGATSSNGYKQQVSVNVNGGKHQQDPGQWHRLGGSLHRPAGNTEMHVTCRLKDSSFRDVHSLNSRVETGLSSDTSGEDMGEETRRKQASEGPYSGSMGMFAYPGTPQRFFAGSQRYDAPCADVGNETMASPGYERPTRSYCAAQYSGGRSQQRSATNSKAPKVVSSKWDDAGKWIASPGHNVDSALIQSAHSNEGLVQSPLTLPGIRLAGAGQVPGICHERDDSNLSGSVVDSSSSPNENGNRSSVNENTVSSVSGNTSSANGNTSSVDGNTSSVDGHKSSANGYTSSVRVKDHIQQIENAIQSSLVKGPSISDLAKRRVAPRAGVKCASDKRDTSIITSTMFIQRPKDCKLDGLISPPKLLGEPQAAQNPVSSIPTGKPQSAETPTDAPVKDIFSNGPHPRSMTNFPSSTCVRDCGTDTAQPSSLYRDMGTQMTPNPSVRLSRRANPGTCTESPGRHNTPDHSRRTACLGAHATDDTLDVPTFHVEKLGRSHVGAHTHPLLDRNLNWSTREEEEEESATCLRTQSEGGETQPSPYVAWAAAWEEAERAKYTARFHREEARIQTWEELQKAKAETQMRKTEVRLQKLHESASQKMSNKIAAAHRKAEEMKAAAEACRDELAAKAKHRAEFIRQTGNVPTAFGCFASRLVPFQSNIP